MRQPATIVVPFRSMREGKSRLSSVLSQREREELNRSMLEGVLGAALEVEQHPQVLVVSPDEVALHEARMIDSRIETLVQGPDVHGLNGALEQATRVAIDAGSRVVVVIPADLPLIRGSDIENLLRRDAPVVIAPDRHRQGTNGLMQRIDATRGHFRYQFGIDSYHHHQEEAHRLGLDPVTAVSLGTSFDLDTPGDLAELADLELPGHRRPAGTLVCG
jgi:2-phospho-L-lactate/phosphoenolpyruvate guanylyltransferase